MFQTSLNSPHSLCAHIVSKVKSNPPQSKCVKCFVINICVEYTCSPIHTHVFIRKQCKHARIHAFAQTERRNLLLVHWHTHTAHLVLNSKKSNLTVTARKSRRREEKKILPSIILLFEKLVQFYVFTLFLKRKPIKTIYF